MDITDQLIELTEKINAKPVLFSNIAKTYWNAYCALTLAGFTSEQAMQIISRQGNGIKVS